MREYFGRQQTILPLFRLIGDFDLNSEIPNGFPASARRLVYIDTDVTEEDMDNNRQNVTGMDFIGEVTFETGFTFADTEVGGISGLTYDRANNIYYALSDDRSTINDARFYDIAIDLGDGSLDEGDVEFQEVTTLLNVSSEAFTPGSVDPEGIALSDEDTLYISSEGDANNLIDPFIAEFSLDGQILDELDIPDKFLPTADQSSGIQNNQAFESLTITPDGSTLFTATENALFQDGERSSLESGSPVRILQYDLETEEVVGEFLYETDPIPFAPEPEESFADNGLVELFATDNTGTLLALERSFAEGVGNNIRLYKIDLRGATNISSVDGLLNKEGEITEVDETVSKRLLLDFEVPVPEGEDSADYQVEGMVVDRETGYLYVGQEFGIWKYNAEPNDNREPTLVDTVIEDTDLSQIPFSNLVVFGDSLSDTGNVFNATEGLVPPSPPYASGRFSNGDLIIDAIADYLELPENESFGLGGNNYAFGAAETGEGTSEYGFLLPEPIDVPNIGQQIDLYLSDRTPTETDLFYIYGGINDFVSPLLRGETLPTPESIVGNITTHITELAEAGAQTFVVPNLLSLGDIPLFLEQPEATAILNDVTEEFNRLLDTELNAIASDLDVEIIEPDVYSITTEIQDNPADFGLSNTTDAFFNQTDPISDTTDLSLTGNPEEFFFWDIFHPTATATEIIAQEVIDLLPGGVTQFERETPSLVPDVEGLTIYYGEDGNGYLLPSSQGNNTFAIYDRAGSNSYLDSFAIEGVEESDGADVTNVPLGEDYPAGLLVVQDGSNTPEVVFPDPEDGKIQTSTPTLNTFL